MSGVLPSTPSKRTSRPIRRTPVTIRTSAIQGVDLVTGKATVEYYFDPTLVTTESSSGNESSFKTTAKKQKQDDNTFFSSKHLYMPCTIIKPLGEEVAKSTSRAPTDPYDGPTLVKTADGQLHKISKSNTLVALKSPDDYVGVDDCLHLPDISEASLLHTLKVRFKREDIYTSAGPILISVNPYKSLFRPDGESIYSEDEMLFYRTKQSTYEEKRPHLFEIADRAYSALMDSVKEGQSGGIENEDPVLLMEDHHVPGKVQNQSIIISGESGAGKTEATKIIMKFLASITRKADKPSFITSPDGKMIAALEDRVLSSNPLLESFGNAQTLRNDNSSRFGKFIHINFDTLQGAISGATISNYLLEKTRITTQVEGERNYHVFYQLLASGDDQLIEELGLKEGAEGFRYLGNRSGNSGVQPKDATNYAETKLCLKSIGLDERQQKAVFSIAAAVLHLGNVEFDEEEGSENASVAPLSLPSLQRACALLGLDEASLSEAILTKRLIVNGKTIKKPQNKALAIDKRDSLAMMTYSNLFVWLVRNVNETLQNESASGAAPASDTNNGFIGVLDIYGFETFEVNGFEQLLINYCNEKLQRHFNRHLFEVEQELYANEGVDWSYITFNDNRPCLELIEGGGGQVGILNTLDDSWGGMGSASEKDVKFVAHLHKQFGGSAEGKTDPGHKNYVTPKFGKDNQFIIVHYAGEVKYTADGFVEKNMDTLSNEIRELGDNSALPLPRSVYTVGQGDSAPTSLRSSIRGVSVGSQFRSSLQALVADLDRTQPHYIRCIKPNLSKSPGSFVPGEILKQLRYSGMMEAIRIRREGYALREEHESFYKRFSVLLTSQDLGGEKPGIEKLVKVLSDRLHVTEADWQIGHSKIFLRHELAHKLERLAELRVRAAARVIRESSKRMVRAKLARFLVSWIRFRLYFLKLTRERKAASFMAAWVRRCKQRKQYISFRKAVTLLQARKRRQSAADRVRKIRDPFCDLTFKECKDLLESEQVRLQDAVKSKKFRQAADLEKRVALLKEAVESKRPLTRDILDKRIAQVTQKLDDAVSRKAYEECGPLQEQLDELTAKCEQFPTEDELRAKVEAAEEAVALAATNKDFAVAAERQADLDAARGRLDELLEARGDGDDKENQIVGVMGIESRAQLESEIRELAGQVKAAIAEKDFSKANSVQQTLGEKEGLRKFFPTVEEIQTQIKDTKLNQDDAIAKKDFMAASNMDKKISELEKQLQTEKAKASELGVKDDNDDDDKLSVMTLFGGEMTFGSRAELEKAIARATKEVSKAVAEKDFRRADDTQKDVDALSQLRENLPSLTELESKLRGKKQEMNKAISGKKFALADELHTEVEKLEERVKAERVLQPPPLQEKPRDGVSVKSVPLVAKEPTVLGSSRSVASTPARSTAVQKQPLEVTSSNNKTVKHLRPSRPLSAPQDDSVLSVAQMLATRRGNAAILVGETGGLVGILTDTDVTRRVVAKDVDPGTTCVSEVMTPNPTCVTMGESAMDALSIMVENHFRHLPVVSESRTIVGILDIAKCLNDAIDRLEKSSEKSESAAEDAVMQAVSQQGASAAQTAALQALLGNLMSQAFGKSSTPTLRSLLAGRSSTIVDRSTSIREAAAIMTENRKASLIVEDGKLIGIFGFKDMMTRAVAKELPLESTTVETVMTPDPEAVSPEISVLEALQVMHDNKFLTLPVCEEDGTVVGVVDVMDVIYGCGGAEGWRSLFGSIDIDDDVSDVSSVDSGSRKSAKSAKSSKARKQKTAGAPLSLSEGLAAVSEKEEIDERPVSKLRPSKPIISSTTDSITTVTQLLRSKRAPAAIIVGPEGGLAGIVSDKDITCRVVAKRLDPSSVEIGEVMTPNPICVNAADSALDSLTTMVEKRIRYLPVVDDSGAITGVLDVSKCLNNAITRLEKAEEEKSIAMESTINSVVGTQSGEQAEAMKALLGNLLALGTATTTIKSLLTIGAPTIVSTSTTILEAGDLMAEHRKAALVVDEAGELVGVFGFKDMMTRAIARGLPLEETPVSEVMTPSPETVTPDLSVMEALHLMHDNGFLTLPVCEDDGTVVGVVDVMDLMHGCGGTEGWRKMFASSMEVHADDDDDGSVVSADDSIASGRSARTGNSTKKKKDIKSVSKLRPARPVLCLTTESILSVTQSLQKRRSAAGLLVSPEGSLAGIVTDIDITRRVVAKNVDPFSNPVSAVMTPDPLCVKNTDEGIDALMIMIENHFRHLPVLDGQGSVVGLLDIAKCLNDAIEKMERSQGQASSSAEDVVKEVLKQGGGDQNAALNALLGSLMAQAFGTSSIPSLRSILAGKPNTMVSPTTTVREAGYLMADHRKAALVVDNDELVGIFGFKDMMSRVVAKELDIDFTEIQDVMTGSPETVTPDMTALEALQMMHDNKFLTLPVCEDDGQIVGVVDVMDVMFGCGGPQGWRSMFEQTMEMDDLSDSASAGSNTKGPPSTRRASAKKNAHETPAAARLPGHIPTTLEFDGEQDMEMSKIRTNISHDELSGSIEALMGHFKITDPTGATHRVKCVCTAEDLISLAAEKVGINRHCLRLRYVDDEGDTVNITADDDVVEAWNHAVKAGQKVAKLTAVAVEGRNQDELDPLMLVGVGLAVVGAAAFMLLRPGRR